MFITLKPLLYKVQYSKNILKLSVLSFHQS
nr:MAG TPA: hypothetical protein [Caudoviricetes sp.]DAY12883.1 MAG TPA: hypothetical protein [Caudoviricetes sp.]